MIKHFVTFFSPGAFVAEQTTKPIESWDVVVATDMAGSVIERYNAGPYGFRFTTRARGDDELDSKVVETSSLYYLGGRIETLEEIEARNDPNESILRGNMRVNSWDRVVVNANDDSWPWAQPLKEGDVVL